MTNFTCAKTGQLVSLTEEIANSGEGKVWRTSRKGMLAKIYHVPDEERAKKLDIMVKHAPADPNAHKNHVSFAWPQSVLKDAQGKVVGFLMPEIVGSEQLVNVCNPSRRKRLGLELDWRFLHVTARNVAALIQAIHKEGYVLGDIKLQNILVNSRALPSIIDIDSFQVKDAATGKTYRCPVGSEGFTPVELLGKDISNVTQQEVHDRFRLGIVIYHLLFGNHPFQGKWEGPGESPEINELIRQGFWPDAPNSLLRPSNRTIPLKVASSAVIQCFLKCFNLGHTNPSARPKAEDWVEALEEAMSELMACAKIGSHYHSAGYKRCFWCERENLLGTDIFEFPNATPLRPANRYPTISISQPSVPQTPAPLTQSQSPISKPYISQKNSFQNQPQTQGVQPVSATFVSQCSQSKTGTQVASPFDCLRIVVNALGIFNIWNETWFKAALSFGGVGGFFLGIGAISMIRTQPSVVAISEISPPPDTALLSSPFANSLEPSIKPTIEPTTTAKATCGDPEKSGQDWYPVFINNGDLEQVRRQYCQDAITKIRDDSTPAVQVASFTDRQRAVEFAEQVGGDVGQPYQQPSLAITSASTCGDPHGSGQNWYPVFINNADLEEIWQKYCQDAINKTRDNGTPAVQVASFTDRLRAVNFANRVGGDVGRPY
jgi:serine/threonine protein kinase